MPRSARTLQIYLPIGSEEGQYEVGLFRTEDEPAVRAHGIAELRNQSVILEINLDLPGISPGEYLLGIRRPEFSWHYHMIDVDE